MSPAPAEYAQAARIGEVASACVDVCYAHTGRLDWDTAQDLVRHALRRTPSRDYLAVIAVLAARVATLERSLDKDAALTMRQIARIVADFQERHGADPDSAGLRGADLSGAGLRGVDLTRAYAAQVTKQGSRP